MIETPKLSDTGNECCQKSSWFGGWLQRRPEPLTMLRAAEKKILSYLKTPYRGWYVDIGPVVGPADKIWTISLNEESDKTPIVLLHGLGAGVALWCLNLDSLAEQRPVYAIDLLGFGRSSRPSFSSKSLEAEKQLVKSVEEWRREMQLNRIILLGHSLGGFLAASYAMHYPERVKHLILADPWGFPEKPADFQQKFSIPLWAKAVAYVMQPFNPLSILRLGGQWVIEKLRPDIIKMFAATLNDDVDLIPKYIYHCNAQTPSGESAFHCMMGGFGWAKNPMCNRINTLEKDIPITLLYGSRSWVDNATGDVIKEKRPDSYVNIQVVTGAGHYVYADKADVFNKYVNEICQLADSGDNLRKLSMPKLSSLPDLEDERSNTESDENISATESTREPTPQNTPS